MRPTPGPDTDFDTTPSPAEAYRRVAEAAHAQAAADRNRAQAERALAAALKHHAEKHGRGARVEELRARIAAEIAEGMDRESETHEAEARRHETAMEAML